jgi:hypothetical protein
MAITDLSDLQQGMQGGQYYQPININSQSGGAVGFDLSLWRMLAYPLTPAIPGAAAILNASTPGALPLAPRTSGQDRIIAELTAQMTVVGNNLQVEDRLAHMGGLNGTLTTPQTVGIDLDANLGVSNLLERLGASDYSEIEWFLEWYTATGGTITTPTLQATFHDGATGSVNIWNPSGGVALPATVSAGRRYKILPSNGKWIRALSTLSLSLSTGTAGNFGVTARKLKTRIECQVANSMRTVDWSYLRSPSIRDNSCISYALTPLNAVSGAISGGVTQAVK